ncbi:MAG: dTMP kinase [Alphaproteobacteria bacterium]|nr:dTMP kinase [Alphaproteobacteria bacterium]
MEDKAITGLFITFEGGEGAGKTTQVNRLARSLSERGHYVVTTREPGGTPESEKIRQLLVQRDAFNWNPIAETLMFFAARSMHIESIIKPALKEGSIVISDRFTDSTVAYQGYGKGLDLGKIRDIEKVSIDGFKPDLTFLLDIDINKGLERSTKCLSSKLGYEKTEDRFERMETEFHKRLRQGFLEIAKKEKKRIKVFDAEKDAGVLAEGILEIVLGAMK